MSEAKRPTTVFGEDCRMKGELTLDSDAVIEGQFQGTLRVSGDLELPASADVSGLVLVGRLRLAGKVNADVVASDTIELLSGARLNGRVFTPNLTMGPGVVFEGAACIGPRAAAAAKQMLELAPAIEARQKAAEPPLEPTNGDQSEQKPQPVRESVATIAEVPGAKHEQRFEAPPDADAPALQAGSEPRPAAPEVETSADDWAVAANAGPLSQAPPTDPAPTDEFKSVLESVQHILRKRRPQKANDEPKQGEAA